MPEMVTDVAFCVAHVSTVEPPPGMVDGSAVNDVITGSGAGGAGVTVTAATAVAVPPEPVAVNVYEVLSDGDTCTEPDAGWSPFTPLMFTFVALVVAQVSVTAWPTTTEDGFAVNEVMVGADDPGSPPGLPFPFKESRDEPHPAPIRTVAMQMVKNKSAGR